jgi:hypothetical protein
MGEAWLALPTRRGGKRGKERGGKEKEGGKEEEGHRM